MAGWCWLGFVPGGGLLLVLGGCAPARFACVAELPVCWSAFGVVELLAVAACWLGERVREGCDGLLSAFEGIRFAASVTAMSLSGTSLGV